MSGYVYAIACGDLVKIGYSADPWSRFVKLKTDNAADAKLLGAVPGTLKQEKELHRLLSPWRSNGEWFWRGSLAVETFISNVRPLLRSVAHPKNLIWKLRGVGFPAAKLADALGVNKSTVTYWSRHGTPADRADDVERLTGIPKHELRPDVWNAPRVEATE